MFANSKGMVQVSGATYRIVQVGSDHRVFRLLDDRFVGSFRYVRGLAVLESPAGAELLSNVARQALRASLVAWRPLRGTRHAASGWARAIFAYVRALLFFGRNGKAELTRKLA
jgi:hypothetical protein